MSLTTQEAFATLKPCVLSLLLSEKKVQGFILKEREIQSSDCALITLGPFGFILVDVYSEVLAMGDIIMV